MPGIGVVVNPYARANQRRKDRLERLQHIVGTDGIVAQTNGLREIDDVAREFLDRSIEILAVCGGDGTIFRTVTAFRRTWGDRELPMLLPLRAGTINVIASSIDCSHGSPERAHADVQHGAIAVAFHFLSGQAASKRTHQNPQQKLQPRQ